MERTNIFGGRTNSPSAAPGEGSALVPIAVNGNGVQWVNLVANGIVINGVPNNTDAVAVITTNSVLPAAAYQYVFDHDLGVWQRASSFDTGQLSNSTITPSNAVKIPLNAALLAAYNGSDFVRLRTGNLSSAGNFNNIKDGLFAIGPVEWSITHDPGAGVKATISKGADATGAHVCRGFSISLNAVAAIAAPIQVVVRDGATGAGTILWSARLTAPAGTTIIVERNGLNIRGSVNTAMTIEFAAAPAGTDFQAVNLNGYTLQPS